MRLYSWHEAKPQFLKKGKLPWTWVAFFFMERTIRCSPLLKYSDTTSSKSQGSDKGRIAVISVPTTKKKKKDSRDVITFKCILILHSAFPSQQTLFHLNKMDITHSTVFYIKCSCKRRTTTLEWLTHRTNS